MLLLSMAIESTLSLTQLSAKLVQLGGLAADDMRRQCLQECLLSC